MAQCGEFVSQLNVVVDSAITCDAASGNRIDHWLCAFRTSIDYRQSSMTQNRAAFDVDSFTVWTSVAQTADDSLDRRRIRYTSFNGDFARDPTHHFTPAVQ